MVQAASPDVVSSCKATKVQPWAADIRGIPRKTDGAKSQSRMHGQTGQVGLELLQVQECPNANQEEEAAATCPAPQATRVDLPFPASWPPGPDPPSPVRGEAVQSSSRRGFN